MVLAVSPVEEMYKQHMYRSRRRAKARAVERMHVKVFADSRSIPQAVRDAGKLDLLHPRGKICTLVNSSK